MESFVRLEQLKEFDNLELLAKQVVEGFIIGLHKSPFHGFSVEFAEHRQYNSGESTKNIDWKVFARTEKLFVKRFEEETNLRCQLVIDQSSSMFFPKDKMANKIRFSVLCSAAIIHMLKKQRDAFGLSLFSKELDVHTRARSTTSHQKRINSYLENALSESNLGSNTALAESLHHIADAVPRRSLVLIFSDMFEQAGNQKALFGALQHLKYQKHEVVVFNVIDEKLERDFEFENRPYQFIDMETGEKLKLQSNQVKAYYQERVGGFLKSLKLQCAEYAIDYVEADINKEFKQVLLPYLVRRMKMH